MTIKNLLLCSMVIFLFSCKPSNPETILGIKLGLPEKAQTTDPVQAGKIKTEDNKQYVDYGYVRGYLTTWTTTSSEDVELITGINLKFINPSFEHPNVKNNEWVSEFDMNNLIESYKGKYGEPKIENNNGFEERKWKKAI